MGLTPSRGGSLPAPRTHLSSRIRSRDQPGAADKMAAAAFSSGPHRNSTSARLPDRTWSRQDRRPVAEPQCAAFGNRFQVYNGFRIPQDSVNCGHGADRSREIDLGGSSRDVTVADPAPLIQAAQAVPDKDSANDVHRRKLVTLPYVVLSHANHSRLPETMRSSQLLGHGLLLMLAEKLKQLHSSANLWQEDARGGTLAWWTSEGAP
ncbi:hypothetical protein NDU88_001314 [Pleurodeles waltl]|uniref:Uncharacterized protein n=1 Tax=Pleurodeles waltl TaxID=8319 RepID=A0AAV7VBJ1_PLEWA|nr:hypothetical protein NDU88_001314 [Pleurodeles waltl]